MKTYKQLKEELSGNKSVQKPIREGVMNRHLFYEFNDELKEVESKINYENDLSKKMNLIGKQNRLIGQMLVIHADDFN